MPPLLLSKTLLFLFFKTMLPLFLLFSLCSAKLIPFSQHEQLDYAQHDDLPEDNLIEFFHSDTHGRTFPLGQESFDAQRRLWRANAASVIPTDMPIDEVMEMILENNRYETKVPLRVFIKALWNVWPDLADDIPKESKIAAMELDKLVTGDWQWVD
jgi:hypothetical protein